MPLEPQVLSMIDQAVLCWLATCSTAGEPNVSPKEVFAALGDDAIIIANIASPNSARNLRENPRAAVSFVNIFTQRGFQVRGSARVLTHADEEFPAARRILERKTEGVFPFKVVFLIRAEEVREIIAPRYRLFPDTTEAQQVRDAMKTYGVRPEV